MARIKMTAEEFADKQASRLKNAVPEIQKGIERVTESPTAKAAARQDKMLTNLTNAVQSGRWASRLKAVTLDEWKQKALSKGVGRIATGIDQARPKVVEFAGQLLEHEGKLQDEIDKMPDLTLEDSINRMTAWTRGMVKFKRK